MYAATVSASEEIYKALEKLITDNMKNKILKKKINQYCKSSCLPNSLFIDSLKALMSKGKKEVREGEGGRKGKEDMEGRKREGKGKGREEKKRNFKSTLREMVQWLRGLAALPEDQSSVSHIPVG